ncbi:MAG: M28 family peptidase [Deltaproteobacteria bacterium]|nr:M28 family peptidase [Deltaproteobacteria bacterium]
MSGPITIPSARLPRRRGPVEKAPQPPAFDEKAFVRELIERIVAECPRRQPTSEDERKAQGIVEAEFARLGLATGYKPFRFNDNLYSNLALHTGLGTLGTMVSGVSPFAGLALHLTSGLSYLFDSTRKGYFLRRVLGFKPSQNLLAVLPAEGEPRLRVVITAHIDAAFTGWIFKPEFVKAFSSAHLPKGFEFMGRAVALATLNQFPLAAIDLLRIVFGRVLTAPLRPLEALLTLPSALAFVMNLQMVLRNEVVPGANDDLSGVAALPILARRLAATKRPDVEYVFAVTGCEEASLGGGDALAKQMAGVWDKTKTVVVGLDMLSLGQLHFLEGEGEVIRTWIPQWLGDACRKVAASEPRFAEVKGFRVDIGGSDVAAFLARGWEGVCLACIDPEKGMPEHYHSPKDAPENMDWDKVIFSIDFAERLVREIVAIRLPGGS